MSSIKGLVLMSRLEYLEEKYGIKIYKGFLKKISTDEVNFSRQPVDGAHTYSDSLLVRIDQILLEDYFDNDLDEFKQLGKWSANNFIYRYFGLYVDKSDPQGFLAQYARLRDRLIGSGEMALQVPAKKNILVSIDYGQPIPKSVCLSEQGFIAGGMNLCGAAKIEISEKTCASDSDNFTCDFEIKFK
jgi:hypothetical protein